MMVKNNAPNLKAIGEEITLLPGVNTVDSKAWAEAKKIPLVQHYLEAKVLEEVAGSSTSTTGSTSDSLKDLNEGAAIRVVQDTLDRTLLSKWKAEETRAKVLDAIAAQLEKLKLDTDTAAKKPAR